MGNFIKHAPCPKCQSSDALAVYDDGPEGINAKCMSCGAFIARIKDINDIGDSEPDEVPAPPMERLQKPCQEGDTVETVAKFISCSVPERGIRGDIYEFYGAKVTIDPFSGMPKAVYYPYTKDNKVTAYKKRIFPKKISSIGSFKGCELYGQWKFKPGGKFIVITEGEEDCHAATQMFRDLGKGYRVVSIPTGATVNEETGEGVVDKSVKINLPYLYSFDTVVICFDADRAGRAVSKALADLLVAHTKVKVMDLPDGEDANSMLLAGQGRQFMEKLRFAREFIPDAVIDGSQITLEELRTPINTGLVISFLPKLMKKMHGLRYAGTAGEITVVCAGSGMGKSTLCRQISHELLRCHSQVPGMIYLEEQHVKTAQGLIAIDNQVPLIDLMEDPNIISESAYERSYRDLVCGTPFINHFGSLATTSLMPKMHYLHQRGCNFIVLDHISLLVSGIEGSSQGERKDLDMLMTELAAFVTMTGVHIIAVVHLKRKNAFIKKDKDGNIDKETAPYNRGGIISLSDLRGSAGLEQLSWNVWALEGDYTEEQGNDPHLRWVRNLKSRLSGASSGVTDYLRYNTQTGILVPCS